VDGRGFFSTKKEPPGRCWIGGNGHPAGRRIDSYRHRSRPSGRRCAKLPQCGVCSFCYDPDESGGNRLQKRHGFSRSSNPGPFGGPALLGRHNRDRISFLARGGEKAISPCGVVFYIAGRWRPDRTGLKGKSHLAGDAPKLIGCQAADKSAPTMHNPGLAFQINRRGFTRAVSRRWPNTNRLF